MDFYYGMLNARGDIRSLYPGNSVTQALPSHCYLYESFAILSLSFSDPGQGENKYISGPLASHGCTVSSTYLTHSS